MKNATMSVRANGMELVFEFNGLPELKLDVAQLTEGIQRMAMVHGIKQKCVDAAALSRDPATGRSATAREKYDAVRGMLERLTSGTWNDRGAGAGETGGALLNALCAAYPARSRADLAEWLKGKSDKEKRALRNSDKLKPFLIVEPSAKGDELLGELGS